MRQWLLAIAVAILGTNHSGGDRSHRHRRQLLHVAALHAARVCDRRTAVRIRHGADRRLRIEVAGARGRRQPEVAGRTRCARDRRLHIAARIAGGVSRRRHRAGRRTARYAAGFAVVARWRWHIESPHCNWVSRCWCRRFLFVVVFRDRSFRTFDNLLAGLGIGAIIVAAWAISGTIGHVEEHPNTLQEAFLRTNSGRMESLSFVAPVAYTIDYLMFFSDTSKVVTIGIAAVLGMIAGSAAYALRCRPVSLGRVSRY